MQGKNKARGASPDGGWRKSVNDTTQIIQFPKNLDNALFTGSVQGMLTVLSGPHPGAVFSLDRAVMVIGRSQEVDIKIADTGLSRSHAQVKEGADGFYLEDLGSTNGTFVNGERLTSEAKLEDGDRLQIGEKTVLRFSMHDRLEQEAARQVYEMTVRDPLTRLHNRRHLDERLQGEFAYATRHKTSLSVLVVDVDHFKRVNDTLGHPAGDAVLQALASALQRIVRTEDVLARFGGEEFVIVARGIDEKGAAAFAERIRGSIEAMTIPWQDDQLKVTVSIGLAHMEQKRYPGPDALVAAADGALYQAKRSGRNRVEAV